MFTEDEYKEVISLIQTHRFLDDFGNPIVWTMGQITIIACIYFRRAPDGRARVQIMTTTQYGKSKAVGVGVALRAAYMPGRWALVAPSADKARIIMDNVIKATVQDPLLRFQLIHDGDNIDRLMQERSKDRLTYKSGGEVRVFSVDSRNKQASGEALMGFGCIVEGNTVLTEKGEIEIKDLVENKIANRVWSYNHETGKPELKHIKCYQVNQRLNRDIYELEVGKKVIRMTNDHPVFIKNTGYIPVEKVKPGDVVLSLGFTNAIDAHIIDPCLLPVKSVQRSSTQGLVTKNGLEDISVVENVEESDREEKEIHLGIQKQSNVPNVEINSREGVKSFVQENASVLASKEELMIGHYQEKDIIDGKEKMFLTNHCTSGQVKPLGNQELVNIAVNPDFPVTSSTGQIKQENILEIDQTGLDYVQNATKNMTEMVVSSIRKIDSCPYYVYNLSVEENENYFIEGILLHNSPSVIEDESALIDDDMHAKVMRMLGGFPDNNFLLKIGNPFRRNHFLKSHESDRYYKVVIDYEQAVKEGRLTKQFIEEQRETISGAMFSIFYDCKFPAADAMDDKGWMPLLTEEEVRSAFVRGGVGYGDAALGSDVAGEGRNSSVNIIRWANYMKIARYENEPDVVKWGTKIVTDKIAYRVHAHNVAIDKNGVGLGAYNQVNQLVRSAFTNAPGVIGIISGARANDPDMYDDLKTEMFMRLRKWIKSGGMIEEDERWLELTRVHYRVIEGREKRRVEIMGKLEMKANGWESPDVADAASFTFFRENLQPGERANMGGGVNQGESIPNLDPYS